VIIMKIIADQLFRRVYDQDSAVCIADLEVRKCRFESCGFSLAKDPTFRSRIVRSKIIDCTDGGCVIGCFVAEDVLVEGLKTVNLLQTWGAVFRRVVFRGKIDRVMFSPFVKPMEREGDMQRSFEKANAEFYRDTDWALDISEAQFKECDIRGMPAKLIRRDPETQVVVTREKAIQGKWRQLDLSKTWWGTALQFFIEDGEPDVVLVAPKRHKKYKALLDGLKLLRDHGVAEPD